MPLNWTHKMHFRRNVLPVVVFVKPERNPFTFLSPFHVFTILIDPAAQCYCYLEHDNLANVPSICPQIYLLCSYAIASRKSCSHILQLAVCLGQLYGCLFYFVTAYLAGFNFWASPFYFWAYFVGANSAWVVVPTIVAIRSWRKICAAFEAGKMKNR
jgi:hypothetical protein